jgi:hypothetical protein
MPARNHDGRFNGDWFIDWSDMTVQIFIHNERARVKIGPGHWFRSHSDQALDYLDNAARNDDPMIWSEGNWSSVLIP